MRYCADTWFFIELSKKAPEAIKIMRSLGKKKNELIIPSITILELTRLSIRSGKIDFLNDMLNQITKFKSIKVIDCDIEISKLAGVLSATFNIPTVDSIIAATSIKNNCHNLISKDTHFQILEKHKRIKIISW